MASLSDFRVSVQRDSRVPTLSAALPPEQAAQKEPPPSGMASKTADYAKVDKPSSLKGKSGSSVFYCLLFLIHVITHIRFSEKMFLARAFL